MNDLVAFEGARIWKFHSKPTDGAKIFSSMLEMSASTCNHTFICLYKSCCIHSVCIGMVYISAWPKVHNMHEYCVKCLVGQKPL